MTEAQRDEIRVETIHKRVRAYVRGQLVADTVRPALVWEIPYYPAYYIPVADLRAKLEPDGTAHPSRRRGDGVGYDVVVDGAVAAGAARIYPGSPQLSELVRLEWNAMDEWFEEDEPIYVHPRDPYSRVDILAASRHVRVEIDGVTVADSHTPRILFETGLPARYYLPLTDIRMDLLRPSDTHTSCPYKGNADYWNIEVGGTEYSDLVWIYRTPTPESQKIAGLACFYNEKVDLYIDDELQQRPETPFG